MANSTNFGRQTKEKSRFFLNTTEIAGIQIINGSYNTNADHINYLGISNCRYAPRGNYKSNFSIDSLLISNDQFIGLTGATGFNGYIISDKSFPTKDNFSFTSGYLSSYNLKCSIGQIPNISVGIDVYGNAGKFHKIESTSSRVHGDFLSIPSVNSNLLLSIADPGSLNISLDEFTTNRCLSYNLSINVKRLPIYPLGYSQPLFVETIYPIEVNCSFQLEKSDYLASTLRDFPGNEKTQNLTISMNDLENGLPFTSYNFNEMKFMGESYSSTVDGNVGVNLNYKTYLQRPN